MQKQIGVTLFQYNPISTSSPTSNLEEREGPLMLWAGGYLQEQILEKVTLTLCSTLSPPALVVSGCLFSKHPHQMWGAAVSSSLGVMEATPRHNTKAS